MMNRSSKLMTGCPAGVVKLIFRYDRVASCCEVIFSVCRGRYWCMASVKCLLPSNDRRLRGLVCPLGRVWSFVVFKNIRKKKYSNRKLYCSSWKLLSIEAFACLHYPPVLSISPFACVCTAYDSCDFSFKYLYEQQSLHLKNLTR